MRTARDCTRHHHSPVESKGPSLLTFFSPGSGLEREDEVGGSWAVLGEASSRLVLSVGAGLRVFAFSYKRHRQIWAQFPIPPNVFVFVPRLNDVVLEQLLRISFPYPGTFGIHKPAWIVQKVCASLILRVPPSFRVRFIIHIVGMSICRTSQCSVDALHRSGEAKSHSIIRNCPDFITSVSVEGVLAHVYRCWLQGCGPFLVPRRDLKLPQASVLTTHVGGNELHCVAWWEALVKSYSDDYVVVWGDTFETLFPERRHVVCPI